MTLALDHGRPLAPLTTLGLGGPAKHFVEVKDRATLLEALRWAEQAGERVAILGGGSNLVVSDAGFDGLVVRVSTRGIEVERADDHALVKVEAGEPWEHAVELALEESLQGFECLVGIPGSSGATPIQNVGAYGQEVSDTLIDVEVLERATWTVHVLAAHECSFRYRDSLFKREPERFVVLAARFRLRQGGAPRVEYAELARALAAKAGTPSLRDVASAVYALRKQKSMVLDPGDENGRSAGSFFTNPIVSGDEAERVRELAVARGLVARPEDVPSFATGDGAVKLAAGWLIERAGIAKGLRRGAVGVSTKHALSLVHHGGGTTRELLAFADEIKAAVRGAFGVELAIEPVRW